MTTIQSGGPWSSSAHQLHLSRDATSIITPKLFLAGAASLGLRRMLNKAIIDPSGHSAPHQSPITSQNVSQIGKSPKDEACTDEGHTPVRSQPQVNEAVMVPQAPCKPKPQGRGRRPLICGAPVLVIP